MTGDSGHSSNTHLPETPPPLHPCAYCGGISLAAVYGLPHNKHLPDTSPYPQPCAHCGGISLVAVSGHLCNVCCNVRGSTHLREDPFRRSRKERLHCRGKLDCLDKLDSLVCIKKLTYAVHLRKLIILSSVTKC